MYLSKKYLSLMLQTFGISGHPKTSTSAIAQFLCCCSVIARFQSETVDLSANSDSRKEFEKAWDNFMGEGKDNSIRAIAGTWDSGKPKRAIQALKANFLTTQLARAATSSRDQVNLVPAGKSEVDHILSQRYSLHPQGHPLLSLGLPVTGNTNYFGVRLHQDWRKSLPQYFAKGNESFPHIAILSVLARYADIWGGAGYDSVCENLRRWLESSFPTDVSEFLQHAVSAERALFEKFLRDRLTDSEIYSETRDPLPIIQDPDHQISLGLRKRPHLLDGVYPKRGKIYPKPLDPDKLGGKTLILRINHENYTGVMKKIECSTQEHQKMLEVLTRFLQSHFPETAGYSYDGNGCDLLMCDSDRTIGLMFEVKTTTRKNYISQVRAAIGQLVDYWVSLDDAEPDDRNPSLRPIEKIHLVAFIQNPKDWKDNHKSDSHEHATKMFDRCKLHVVFVDDDGRWQEDILTLVRSLSLLR